MTAEARAEISALVQRMRNGVVTRGDVATAAAALDRLLHENAKLAGPQDDAGSETVGTRVSMAISDAIKARAEARGITKSEYLRRLIVAALR